MKSYIFILVVFISCNSQVKKAAPGEVNEVLTSEEKKVPLNKFQKEIDAFVQEDSQIGIQEDCLLFTGSSSIRLWSSLKEDMVGYNVLNRSFGGSTIPEVIHYADEIFGKHVPMAIVLYCGENDLSAGATPAQVLKDFKSFVHLVEKKYPEIKLIYITMKPSIARWNIWNSFKKGNLLIANYIATKENLYLMDVSASMIQENGQVKTDIFLVDGLHMNDEGYVIWKMQLRELLDSIFNYDE